MYDHVLVDEAQDLHASQWRLLRAVAPGPEDGLFIVGDAFQRIYGDTVSLRSLGIETRGRSIRLRRNYRTTHEIASWALGVIGDATVSRTSTSSAPTCTAITRSATGRCRCSSPIRIARRRSTASSHRPGWLDDGYTPEAIAVASRDKRELGDLVTALQRAGVTGGAAWPPGPASRTRSTSPRCIA